MTGRVISGQFLSSYDQSFAYFCRYMFLQESSQQWFIVADLDPLGAFYKSKFSHNFSNQP